MAPISEEATERRLRQLVAFASIVAAGILAWALSEALDPSVGSRPSITTICLLTGLCVISRLTHVRVRVRATQHSTNWNSTALLVTLAVIDPWWAVIAIAIGAPIAAILLRLPPTKFIFSIAKELVVAGSGCFALAMLDITRGTPPTWRFILSQLVIYIVMELADDLVTIPVIAVASRTPVLQRFVDNFDIKLLRLGTQALVAIGTVIVVSLSPQSVMAIPGLALSFHLWYSNRIRARSDREAWQQLAGTTEGLNDVNLDDVLHLGITHAASLFSVDLVEIAYYDKSGERVVRGDAEHVDFDGVTPNTAPASIEHTIAIPLHGSDDSAVIGELRLHFRGKVTLSERERYTLRTFASALCTALRNAAAYAELERVAAEHAHAATHDSLTGLTNRRALLDQGGKLLGQRNEHGVMALLLIDLDHFKEINDSLGHAAGDQVIIAAAQRLRATAHPGDIVARLGGDEFAVLLTGLPAPAVATHRAEQLLATLHNPVDIEGMRVGMEASGGVAVATGTSGMVELLRRADVAMYQAKRAGDRVAVYTRRRDGGEVGRRARDGERPPSLASQQFAMTYQPIVDLADGQVIAAEALARWRQTGQHADDPHAAQDIVDRGALVPELRDAVLNLALAAAADWREAGFDIPVAVNIAPHSLLDPDFPSSVIARLRTFDLPADRLVLELTETLALTPLEVVQRVLNQVREAGVRLTLDDFGSGYASLAVLSQLPLQQIKIGQDFVQRMETSAEAAAVVRSSVELGRGLGLTVIAEGIETETQRRILWELGCTAGQGHLFARPMAASRLVAALHRGSGGRPGVLADPLHDEGAVIRIPTARRSIGRGDRLPHLPA